MELSEQLADALARIERRLDGLEQKIDSLAVTKRKSLEWIGQISEHVRSLDDFREEVRASLEPIFHKLEHVDEVVRILRHATSDVARRVERLEPPAERLVG
ncbi:MAG: hypothetical protein AAB426_10105 [Myxococcota bacterium]